MQAVLGQDPLTWIEQRRKKRYRHPDGVTVGPMTFRALAELLTETLQKAGVPGSVTWESVRTWYRAKHPAG